MRLITSSVVTRIRTPQVILDKIGFWIPESMTNGFDQQNGDMGPKSGPNFKRPGLSGYF